MDNFINIMSGAISTILIYAFILLIAIPAFWSLIRFIIALFPPRKRK